MTTSISTPSQIKAKLGLHGVLDMDALKAFSTVYQGLLNNSSYPATPVTMPAFKAGIDQFSALIIQAEDGSKTAIAAKDKQRKEVVKMYTQLGHYVEAACNDDPAVFATSGFTAVVKTKTAPQPLTKAAFVYIDRGPNSGQAIVKPEGQPDVIAFDVRYGLEVNGAAPGSWTVVTLTNARKATISGLTQAGVYQFQIRALGKLGYTDWMDSTTFVCA